MKGTVISRETNNTSGALVDTSRGCKELQASAPAFHGGTVELRSRKRLDRGRIERDSRRGWRRHSGRRVAPELRLIRGAQKHRKHEAES